MLHYRLRYPAQFGGMFTDLFILGATRGTNGASDFTAAATSQSFNLLKLNVGDAVIYPLAHVLTKTAFAGTSVSSVKCDVGNTDGATAHVTGTAGDLSTANFVRASAAASAPYSCQAASKYITALVTNGGAGNMTAVTAGEVWIYATIARIQELLSNRQG